MRECRCAGLSPRFHPDRQRRVLFIWERAIEQADGYFQQRHLADLVDIAGGPGRRLASRAATALGAEATGLIRCQVTQTGRGDQFPDRE